MYNFKINSAVATDRTRRQWIDLGIRTEACMTRPDTCGAAGGAISLWVRFSDCLDWAGVISTYEVGTRLKRGTLNYELGLIKVFTLSLLSNITNNLIISNLSSLGYFYQIFVSSYFYFILFYLASSFHRIVESTLS